MRIAFCFYGQPRDVKRTLTNIKESWGSYQSIDFFVHTWINEEHKNNPFRKDVPLDVYDEATDKFILNTLNPVSFIFEPQIIFGKKYEDSKNWGCYNPLAVPYPSQNIQSHFYSIKKCNELKNEYEYKNKFKYDCVVSCRFDYLFNKKYNVSDFDLNKLNVKNDCNHTDYALNDHLAFSNGNIMDIYCSLFDFFDIYYSEGIEFNPEVTLGHHIKVNNIPVSKSLGDDSESFISTREERYQTYFGNR